MMPWILQCLPRFSCSFLAYFPHRIYSLRHDYSFVSVQIFSDGSRSKKRQPCHTLLKGLAHENMDTCHVFKDITAIAVVTTRAEYPFDLDV